MGLVLDLLDFFGLVQLIGFPSLEYLHLYFNCWLAFIILLTSFGGFEFIVAVTDELMPITSVEDFVMLGDAYHMSTFSHEFHLAGSLTGAGTS